MKNCLFDIIIKTTITFVACITLTCACVHLYNISDTLNQIKKCEYQKKEYPTLKNIEVQNEKIDSLLTVLGKR